MENKDTMEKLIHELKQNEYEKISENCDLPNQPQKKVEKEPAYKRKMREKIEKISQKQLEENIKAYKSAKARKAENERLNRYAETILQKVKEQLPDISPKEYLVSLRDKRYSENTCTQNEIIQRAISLAMQEENALRGEFPVDYSLKKSIRK